MVYTRHLKCRGRKAVWVRVPPWALEQCCSGRIQMELKILVLLFVASGPLTVEKLFDLWRVNSLPQPIDSFMDFILRLCKSRDCYIAVNSKEEIELTAEGASYLHSTGLVLFLYHAVTHLNANREAYRSFDSIRYECQVRGALATLASDEVGILVPNDGQPADVSDELCESHRLGTGHA